MMVRWLARLLIRRLRWLALVYAARGLARRSARPSMDRASDELRERLPDGVVHALSAMPGDPIRVGGSAMATSRGARSAFRATRKTTGSASRLVRWVSHSAHGTRGFRRRFVDQVREESELDRRRMWSEYRRAEGDHQAADEILLERRDAFHPIRKDELPVIPDAVPTGRFRSVDEPPRTVDRRLRSYRRPIKPWDRPRSPLRRHLER